MKYQCDDCGLELVEIKRTKCPHCPSGHLVEKIEHENASLEDKFFIVINFDSGKPCRSLERWDDEDEAKAAAKKWAAKYPCRYIVLEAKSSFQHDPPITETELKGI